MAKHSEDLGDPFPWTQRTGESAQAYEAFRSYLRTRSQRDTAEELGKNINLIQRWSTRWRWIDRVNAYDIRTQTEESQEFLDELSEVRTSHLRLSKKLMEHLDKRLDHFIARNLDPTTMWTNAFREAAAVQQRALAMRETDAADSATVDKIVAVLRERVEG